jgi:hypothetical protein
MKKSLFAYAAISALAIVSVTAGTHSFTRAATPSPSTTFPSLTTIYVASGVYDGGAGAGTSVHCSNVSGQSTQVRVVILNDLGAVRAAVTIALPHGATETLSTQETVFGGELNLSTGLILQGALNIESTQSAVFCTAMIVPSSAPETGVPLHMVRVNGHPGTIE